MNKVTIIVAIILILAIDVSSSPGRTNANGCHTCRTNCAQYGLQDGEYHCHNKNNTSINSNTTTSSATSTVKSTSTTTSKKTTSTEKIINSETTEINNEITGDAVIALESSVESTIEKDIYPRKVDGSLKYESNDYKAKRFALYLFSLILILLLIKLMFNKSF